MTFDDLQLYLTSLPGFSTKHAMNLGEITSAAVAHFVRLSAYKNISDIFCVGLEFMANKGVVLLKVLSLLYCERHGARSLQRSYLYNEAFWRCQALRYEGVSL